MNDEHDPVGVPQPCMLFHSLFQVFTDYDPRSQLQEITRLLEHLDGWTNQLDVELRESRSEDLVYQSAYRDAAISMAAIGAIAPFIEGLLVHMFAFLKSANFDDALTHKHDRWRAAISSAWDPHVVFSEKTGQSSRDIARGAIQLMEALGIRDRFPRDLFSVLEALFVYRNRMLHNGTEWPVEVRDRFEKTVSEKQWDRWFMAARNGDRSWCFYMTDVLIKTSLRMAEELLCGFARVLDEWEKS